MKKKPLFIEMVDAAGEPLEETDLSDSDIEFLARLFSSVMKSATQPEHPQ